MVSANLYTICGVTLGGGAGVLLIIGCVLGPLTCGIVLFTGGGATGFLTGGAVALTGAFLGAVITGVFAGSFFAVESAKLFMVLLFALTNLVISAFLLVTESVMPFKVSFLSPDKAFAAAVAFLVRLSIAPVFVFLSRESAGNFLSADLTALLSSVTNIM